MHLVYIVITPISDMTFILSSYTAPTDIYTLSLHDALPISLANEGHAGATAGVERPCERIDLQKTIGLRESSSPRDRKSTRLNSSHLGISYAVFCLKKKK